MANGPKPGDIILTTNQARTIFVDRVLEGRKTEQLADSVTWNRKRYLSAFLREGHAAAPAFTERKIRQYGAPHVAAHLAEVGIHLEPGTRMYFLGSTYIATTAVGQSCTDLGVVPEDWN